MSTESDYKKYRGKCKELCLEILSERAELILVRGFYHCPMWGKQQHWWLKDGSGNIIDPSVNQFPTKGLAAEYEEFNGEIACSECGTVKQEEEMSFESNYAFCSYKCHGKFIGVLA